MDRIVDYNPLTGETVTFRYDHALDRVVLGHHQDVEPIIERNKQRLLDTDKHRQQAKDDWAMYASVPNVTIVDWRKNKGVDFFKREDWPRVMKLINDPDYKYLKTTTYHHDR